MELADIIKSLNICATAEREYECDGCAYRNSGFDCNSQMMRDAAKALEKLTAEVHLAEKMLNAKAVSLFDDEQGASA